MQKIIDTRLLNFYPMLLSSEKGREDSEQEHFAKWNRFKLLSQPAKDILTANQTAEDIDKIGRGFHFSDQETEIFARMVRALFFGDIKIDSLPKEISKYFPSIQEKYIQSLTNIIKNRFYTPAFSTQPKQEAAQFEKLPLVEALRKYPLLASQLLSHTPLIVGKNKESVRPTVENWIKQYQFELGMANRDPMKRGNFLFLSAGAKQLAPHERQKVAAVLKSLDEGELLSIDIMKQEIAFNLPMTARRHAPAMEEGHFNQVQASPGKISPPAQKQIRPMMSMNNPPIASDANIPNRFFKSPVPHTFEPKTAGENMGTTEKRLLKAKNSSVSFSSGQKMPSEQAQQKSAPDQLGTKNRPPLGAGHTAKNFGEIIDLKQ